MHQCFACRLDRLFSSALNLYFESWYLMLLMCASFFLIFRSQNWKIEGLFCPFDLFYFNLHILWGGIATTLLVTNKTVFTLNGYLVEQIRWYLSAKGSENTPMGAPRIPQLPYSGSVVDPVMGPASSALACVARQANVQIHGNMSQQGKSEACSL